MTVAGACRRGARGKRGFRGRELDARLSTAAVEQPACICAQYISTIAFAVHCASSAACAANCSCEASVPSVLDRELPFVAVRQTWGEDRVSLFDEDGGSALSRIRRDAADIDPSFVVLCQPRIDRRLGDAAPLGELRDLAVSADHVLILALGARSPALDLGDMRGGNDPRTRRPAASHQASGCEDVGWSRADCERTDVIRATG